MNDIPTVHALPRDRVFDAETVTVYRMDDGPQTGMTVVEITDTHGIVIGRTITDADGTRQDIGDYVLDRSPVQRCNDWAVHPIGGGKRLTAIVAPGVSSNPGTLTTMAAQHGDKTATA